MSKSPVASTETPCGTTRVTSRMISAKIDLADYRAYELFVFEHGREPTAPADGPAHEALVRMQTANLALQAQTPAQEWEADSTVKWRRESAAKALVRIARSSHAARGIVGRAVALHRPRERSDRRRRGDATALGGDGGDRPRPSDDDLDRPHPAVSNGDGRMTPAQLRAAVLASNLSANERLIALILAGRIERNGGYCAPSLPILAQRSGLCRRSVQNALARLEATGFIERERRGRGRSTLYRTSSARGAPLPEGS